MDVLVCTGCGTPLTRPVQQLPDPPARQPLDGPAYAPTVPVGQWTIDPDTVLRSADGERIGTSGCSVVHPDDLLELAPHPEPLRSGGCCGRDGMDGPNVVCPGCGAAVATVLDDCWTYHEARLEPQLVIRRPAADPADRRATGTA